MRRSVGGEITFPCNFDIAENPYSFCDQLEATKAALDAGFEREILDEINRLKRLHFSPQIGASMETGQVLDILHEKLYQHFPKKYERRLTSFPFGGKGNLEQVWRSMLSNFRRSIWVGVALITLAGFSHRTSEGSLLERPHCEVRGVWLNAQAFGTEQERQDILRKIDGAHLNTLFLLAPPVQGYPGWSTHEAFSTMLKEGVSRRLSVHGWIPNGFRVPGGTDFTLAQEQIEQPQWAMAVLGKYPSLGHPFRLHSVQEMG